MGQLSGLPQEIERCYPKMTLTVEKIDNAKPGINSRGEPTNKPYKLGDSGGLFLLIHPNGSKWWRLKYRFAGKENQVSIGTYPQISLVEARNNRDILRKLLADGINPSTHLKNERAVRRAEEEIQIVKTRYMIDDSGALSFRLGRRYISLTSTETAELRTCLENTKEVKPKEKPCP